jgi:hypothetical protein
MTDKPPSEDRKLTDDEREAQRRFQETLGRLVNTPHQPHEKSPSAVKAARKKAG